jgi:hypothetical protein
MMFAAEATMNATRFRVFLVLMLPLCGFLSGSALEAHHSIAGEHDTTKTIDVTGVIKESDLENPHSLVKIEFNGKEWLAMLPSPSRLNALGLRNKLLVGSTITVVGYPHRQQNQIYAQRVTIDGKTTEFFSK